MKKLILLILPFILTGCVSSFSSNIEPVEIKTDNVDILCVESDGVWLAEYKECENVSQDWCKQNAGLRYDECGSACRHSSEDVVMCTMQCVPFCSFSSDEVVSNQTINVQSPLVDQIITSPLSLVGEASGTWFFEGDFPVELLDSKGNIMATTYVLSTEDWMTERMVPFLGQLVFKNPNNVKSGILRFKKDNPSGLFENDENFDVPIKFE